MFHHLTKQSRIFAKCWQSCTWRNTDGMSIAWTKQSGRLLLNLKLSDTAKHKTALDFNSVMDTRLQLTMNSTTSFTSPCGLCTNQPTAKDWGNQKWCGYKTIIRMMATNQFTMPGLYLLQHLTRCCYLLQVAILEIALIPSLPFSTPDSYAHGQI